MSATIHPFGEIKSQTLGAVLDFARKEWPRLGLVAQTEFHLLPTADLELVKLRLSREEARDKLRYAAKHWSADYNRTLIIRQFIDVVARFERQSTVAA